MTDLPVSQDESLISTGAALVRFQDDTMMGVAIQRKRDVPTVRSEVLAELEAFPEYADRYYYSIPYKTNGCGNHPSGKMCPHCTLVEGASIHAALAIQRSWGNSFSSWSPRDETSAHIWIDGTFVDYEKNNKWVRPTRFEKGYTRAKDKKWIPLTGERLVKAMNAAGSKAQRNAILAGVPDALKIMIFTKAKELVVGSVPGERLTVKQLGAIREEFAKFDVSMELLESKIGKPSDYWEMRDRATLLGVRTALADGAIHAEVFGSTVAKSESVPIQQETREVAKHGPRSDLAEEVTSVNLTDEEVERKFEEIQAKKLAEAVVEEVTADQKKEKLAAAVADVVKDVVAADKKEKAETEEDPFEAELFEED